MNALQLRIYGQCRLLGHLSGALLNKDVGNAGGAERFKSIVPIAKVMERSIAALVVVMVYEIVAFAKVADLCVAIIVEERAL